MRLGIGGAARDISFAEVTVQLLPPQYSVRQGGYDPGVVLEWRTEVGFLRTWEPPWNVLLGQKGFFDQFTVTMTRHACAVAIEDLGEFDDRFDVPPPSPEPEHPQRFTP